MNRIRPRSCWIVSPSWCIEESIELVSLIGLLWNVENRPCPKATCGNRSASASGRLHLRRAAVAHVILCVVDSTRRELAPLIPIFPTKRSSFLRTAQGETHHQSCNPAGALPVWRAVLLMGAQLPVRWLQQGLYRRNLNPEMAFIQTSKMPITIISKTLLIPISTSLNLLRHEGLVRYVMKQKVVSPFLNVGLYKKPLLLFLRRLAGCRQDWAAEGGLAVKRWAGYPVCCSIFTHMIDAVGATKRAAPRFLLLFFSKAGINLHLL